MMQVVNTVHVYEVDGKAPPVGKDPVFTVESHWNLSSQVILNFGGKKITVVASDLQKAIQNATNWRSY